MGRKPGEPKESVTIRLTPKARQMVKEIKTAWVKRSGWGSTRSYTNSLVIEQAIGSYYKIKITDWKFDFKVCGNCGQNKDDARTATH